MKTARQPVRSHASAFTLVEMLVVIAIIALLAALTMGGYTYAVRGSREKTTRGTFEAVRTALDNYQTEFGEYPEPASVDKTIEFLPNKSYNVGGAACLYQALSGDGFDQIKGVNAPSGGNDDAKATSDGKVQGDTEVRSMMMKEMPQSMWMNKNGIYVLIDGFARPFQYIKAGTTSTSGTGGGGSGSGGQATTINSTYDLWSYSHDEMNTTKKSIDALKDPKLDLKWIKNW